MTSKFQHSVLVTGGTSGLGYQCALEIARQRPNYKVIIAARSDTNKAADAINNALGQNNTQFMPLELSSLAKIRSFVSQWQANQFPPIQSLVFNAALQFPEGIHYSDDGFEKTFAIGHLGHALILALLHRELADQARIVIVSSGTHDPAQKSGLPDAYFVSAEQLAHPPQKLIQGSGRQHYSNTKLANIMYTYSLHRRLQDLNARYNKQWTVNSFDPGLMPGTGLARRAGPLLRFVWHHVFPRITWLLHLVFSPNVHTTNESGQSLARLAIDDAVLGKSGLYFEGRKEIKSSTESYDEKKQEELWQWTINTLAKTDEERVSFKLDDI
jgi:NAD(P)-dependent dehydrogenase (short-subunit alcohol dehydrogenase family)